MRRATFWLVAVLAGCGATGPGGVGVTGLVVRGPVTPVCIDGVPCEAPVAGDFVVRTVTGRRVTGFRTGSDGRFAIHVAPGDYRVEWVGNPLGPQLAELPVGPDGAADVVLLFDTGIR